MQNESSKKQTGRPVSERKRMPVKSALRALEEGLMVAYRRGFEHGNESGQYRGWKRDVEQARPEFSAVAKKILDAIHNDGLGYKGRRASPDVSEAGMRKRRERKKRRENGVT